MNVDDADDILPESVPGPIREMLGNRLSVEALGCMIWYAQTLFVWVPFLRIQVSASTQYRQRNHEHEELQHI